MCDYKDENVKINAKNVNIKTFDAASSAESYGYVKTAAYTSKVKVCDVEYNVENIKQGILEAYAKNVRVLVFQRLCLTGASCGDAFLQQTLLDAALDGLNVLKSFSENKNMLIFVGLPIKNGGKIFDCAACLYNGEILGFTPNVSEFASVTDGRWFSNAADVETVTVFNREYPFSNKIVYAALNNDDFTVKPIVGGISTVNDVKSDASIIVNLSADYEIVDMSKKREEFIKTYSLLNNCAFVFANAGCGESTSDVVYAGGNIIAENGNVLAKAALFSSDMILSDADVSCISFERIKKLKKLSCLDEKVFFDMPRAFSELDRNYPQMPFVPSTASEISERCELILNIQSNALLKRILHVRCKTLILGVSGGLDSTLALLVCKRAMDLAKMDSKNIIAVTMPCFGTTSRTKNNAVDMSNELGVTLKEINVKQSVRSHFKDIGHDENVTDVTYENAQARERTQVLMDVANQNNGIVIGTGDLSELALGWATYNGDHMSMYGVNAGIPKTLIRFVVEYEASRLGGKIKEVLLDVLNTPVSPELIPPSGEKIAQKTEDIVGPYLLHDFYIYYALNKGFKPSKIFYLAKRVFSGVYDDKTLYKWLLNFYNRFFVQQFKRSCSPDGVKIGSLSFSPRGDFMMPSDAVKSVWIAELEKVKPLD